MAEKKEFWTEARLKSGIMWMVVGIFVVIAATVGWWYYLSKPEGNVPKVVQVTIDKALADVKKSPNDVSSHINLAQAYIQAKMLDDAITECQAILKIDKKNEVGMALMGVAYDGKGNKTKAIEYYKKAIDTGSVKEHGDLLPAVVEARFRLGKIYIDQNKLTQAFDIFSYAVATNAADADAKYYLGEVLFKQQKYDKAIEQLLGAVRFVPDYVEANYLLGQSYEKKGMKKEAIAAYKDAIKYNPKYTEAKNALANLEK